MSENSFPLRLLQKAIICSAQCAQRGLCSGQVSVRLFARLSRRSTAEAPAAGGFAAERAPCEREISIDSCGRRGAGGAGAQQQMRTASR